MCEDDNEVLDDMVDVVAERIARSLCLIPGCKDPACRLDHLVFCKRCFTAVSEEDAVETPRGELCESCAEDIQNDPRD